MLHTSPRHLSQMPNIPITRRTRSDSKRMRATSTRLSSTWQDIKGRRIHTKRHCRATACSDPIVQDRSCLADQRKREQSIGVVHSIQLRSGYMLQASGLFGPKMYFKYQPFLPILFSLLIQSIWSCNPSYNHIFQHRLPQAIHTS